MKQNGKTNNSFLLQLGSIPAGHSTPTNVRRGNSNLENVLRTRLAFRSSDVSSFHFQWTNFLKMLKLKIILLWGEDLLPRLLVWIVRSDPLLRCCFINSWVSYVSIVLNSISSLLISSYNKYVCIIVLIKQLCLKNF